MLQTERLSLRPVEQDDLDAWAAFLGDRDAIKLVHFPEPHDRQFSAQLLERTVARADGARTMYAVLTR
ncbi:MAG: hypothetical protein WKF41_17240 [Gaiellaceae bacterium]